LALNTELITNSDKWLSKIRLSKKFLIFLSSLITKLTFLSFYFINNAVYFNNAEYFEFFIFLEKALQLITLANNNSSLKEASYQTTHKTGSLY